MEARERESETEGEHVPNYKWIFESVPHSYHILLVLASILTISPVILVTEYQDLDPFVLAAFRSAIVSMLCVPRLLYYRLDPEPDGKIFKLSVRALFSAFYTVSIYYGFRYMNLADSRTISAFQPVLVSIIACVVLSESCGKMDYLAHTFFVIATLILMRPALIFGSTENTLFSRQYLVATMFTTVGTFFQAGGFTATRVVHDVDVCVVLMWNGLFAIIPSLALSVIFGTFHLPTSEHSHALIICGVMAFLGQACLTIALQVEEAGKVALISKAYDIIVAFMIQVSVYEAVIDLHTSVGFALLVMAMVIMTLKLHVDHSYQRLDDGKCWWIEYTWIPGSLSLKLVLRGCQYFREA